MFFTRQLSAVSYRLSAFDEGRLTEGADEVDGAGGEDEAVGWGEAAGEGEGFDGRVRGMGGDGECARGGDEGVEGGGAGVVDGGEDQVVRGTACPRG